MTCNGNGHTIKIKISDVTDNYQGLFYGIGENATVKNLHVEADIHCSRSRLVGGIAGENDGTIENCWVSGTVRSDWHESGSSYKGKVGGIAGENNGTIKYCCVTANVQNDDANVGGIVGDNSGHTISHCTFYGTVTSSHDQDNKYAGAEGTVENCYDTFNQGEYDAASGKDLYRRAIKYPFAVNVTTVGQGSVTVSCAGEDNVPGARAGQEVTLTTPSGTNADITVTDADGNNVTVFGSSSASGYQFIMQKPYVNVHAVFSIPDWPRQGSGTAESPYLITSADDWNEFALSVNAGNTHSGKHVKLTSNVSTWMMAGASETCSFQGTFDGDGHTLTVSYNTSAAVTAPFRFTKNATISNLSVAGTISTIAMQAAGIVSQADGSLNLTNCRSSVTINSCRDKTPACHGGLVGWVAENGTATISGCVFDGALVSTEGKGNDTECGGFVAMSEGSATITNSLMNPRSVGDGMVTGTFIGASYSNTITNCYYTQAYGTVQGSQVYTITTDDYVTINDISGLGDVTASYGANGITAYAKGIRYDGNCYAGNGETVTLTLSHDSKTGYTFSQYTASNGGTLANAATSTPTLTMPAADVTIGIDWTRNTHELADNVDNTAFINSHDGDVYDITLTGRTLYKDGAWNTLCLPFDVVLSGSPLAGATARPLDKASISGSTLNLTFGEAVTTLKAGTPYIIKWDKADGYDEASEETRDLKNPVFSGVTISSAMHPYDSGEEDGDQRVRFLGTYASRSFDGEDKSILFMGGANTLYYPLSGATLGAHRAYFQIGEDGEQSRAARRITAFNISFGGEENTTGIIEVKEVNEVIGVNDNSWYSLDGRRLAQQPSRAGVYIYKGKKTVIK